MSTARTFPSLCSTCPLRLRAPTHTRIASIRSSNRPAFPPVASPYTLACSDSTTLFAHLVPSSSSHTFSTSSTSAHPRKDSQHKDSINTEATEYSKSGTDDVAARASDAAFNPDVTDPHKQKEMSAGGSHQNSGGDVDNPLDASPANPDISQSGIGKEAQSGAEQSPSSARDAQHQRQRSSGGGSPRKHG